MTSAIIGPRTMEQLTDVLDGADVRLSDEVLDKIDELVPPGTQRQRRRHRLGARQPPALTAPPRRGARAG